MKCYRKNGSDFEEGREGLEELLPSMKCYRKNGSDSTWRWSRKTMVKYPQ